MSLQQKVEEIFEDEGKNSSSLQEELKVNYYDFSQLSNQPTRVGDNIESDNVDASKSFEMFQGKLFKEYTTAGSGFSSNSLKSRLTHFFEEYGLLKNELDSLSKSTKSKDGSVWADMQIVAKQHIEDIESLLSKTNIQVSSNTLLFLNSISKVTYTSLLLGYKRANKEID